MKQEARDRFKGNVTSWSNGWTSGLAEGLAIGACTADIETARELKAKAKRRGVLGEFMRQCAMRGYSP